MKKIIKLILLSLLTFNISFVSFASEEDKNKDQTDQKPGEKIIMTETIKPKEENSEDKADVGPPVKSENKKVDPKKAEGQKNETKNEDQAPKAQKENPQPSEKSAEKPAEMLAEKNDLDLKSIEKAVDDLVNKLDKNSSLTRVLTEVRDNIQASDGENPKANKASKKTEEVIKDYNRKIKTARTESQKKRIENEAAEKIRTINRDTNTHKIHSKNSSNDEDDEDIDSDEDKFKKDKLVIEVKSSKEKEIDRNKIYALADENREEESSFNLNPILLIAAIFLVAILIAIGVAIRKKDIENK